MSSLNKVDSGVDGFHEAWQKLLDQSLANLKNSAPRAASRSVTRKPPAESPVCRPPDALTAVQQPASTNITARISHGSKSLSPQQVAFQRPDDTWPAFPEAAPRESGTRTSLKDRFIDVVSQNAALLEEILNITPSDPNSLPRALKQAAQRGITILDEDDFKAALTEFVEKHRIALETIPRGYPPLHKATHIGIPEWVEALLPIESQSVNNVWKAYGTALHVAIQWGHAEVVKLLLKAPGIDVNKTDLLGCTPLEMAARVARVGIGIEAAELLLKAPGIEVNEESSVGTIPLHTAAKMGHREVAEMLLGVPGIEVNKAAHNGDTPLQLAAKEGRTEVVELLLKAQGIDVNKAPPPRHASETESKGTTPLYLAAEAGHAEVVKRLLKAPGIDVNKPTNGTTPLCIAAQKGYSQVVEEFLKTAQSTRTLEECLKSLKNPTREVKAMLQFKIKFLKNNPSAAARGQRL